jgi:protein involved in sex pheromone biosynthesis
MSFDVSAFEARIREEEVSKIEEKIATEVLNTLRSERQSVSDRLENLKGELAEIDAAIESRTPKTEETGAEETTETVEG